MKKEMLGDSPIKLKKNDPEIIKKNTFHLIKAFSNYDHQIEEGESKKQSVYFSSKANFSDICKTEIPFSKQNICLPMISFLDT